MQDVYMLLNFFFFSPVNNFHNNLISKISEDPKKEIFSALTTTETILRHLPLCPWGENSPAVENHYLFQNKPLTVPQETVENSLRDGNARPLDLIPEKSVCRSRSKS